MVGSVIVHGERIIGEGWHYKAGGPHGEVCAIRSVEDPALFAEATLYVNLEPCTHYGRTPPCSDLIIDKGIRKVVVGTIDPTTKVRGKGIKRLREAGCEVLVGVLDKECRELNKRFFTFHKKERPYIILKWAQSADGLLDIRRNEVGIEEASPTWITNTYSRQRVHQWRGEEQAILVGTNSVIKDNPSLTTRDWKGPNPFRVVIDRKGRIPLSYNVYNEEAKTLVVMDNGLPIPRVGHTIYEGVDFSRPLPTQLMAVLHKHQLQSVIVEGGAATLQNFIDLGLWDEARVFTGVSKFFEGVGAPVFEGVLHHEEDLDRDKLQIYFPW